MIFNLIGPSGDSGGDTPTPPAPIDKTFYIPSTTGWSSDTAGDSVKLRAKISQEYDSATNRSTLKIRLQSKILSGSTWEDLIGNTCVIYAGGHVKVNGNTVHTFPAGGHNDRVTFGESWSTFKNENGDDLIITATVPHASDGTATITIDIYVNIAAGLTDRYLGFIVSDSKTINDGLDVVEDEDPYVSI